MVYLSGTDSRVITIDGKEVNKPALTYDAISEEGIKYHAEEFSRAELRPGRHTFEVWASDGKGSIDAIAVIQAALNPGHVYELRDDHIYSGKTSSDYAVMIVDKTTGAMVGGRTRDAFFWTWNDVQNMLHKMSHEGATRMDIMEQFGVPMVLYPPEMLKSFAPPRLLEPSHKDLLVYKACKRQKKLLSEVDKAPPFIEVGFLFPSPTNLRGCGYLFVEFDPSDKLHNYLFVDAEFNECYSLPLFGVAARFVRKFSCIYQRNYAAYSEYYALSGNPSNAYITLESGIIDAPRKIHDCTEGESWDEDYPEVLEKNVDRVIEELVAKGSILMQRYPGMLAYARQSFTEAAFKKSVTIYGDDAATVERERLSAYKRFVGPDLAQQADRQFSAFFGQSPR